MDDAVDLVAVIDGDGQDVVVAADGGVGIAEDLAELGVAEEAADLALDSLVDVGQFLADLGQLPGWPCRGRGPRLSMQPVIALATGPRSSTGASRSISRAMPFGQSHAIAIHVAGAAERVGDFQQLLDASAARRWRPGGRQADVVQPGEGRRHALAQGVDHLGDQGQLGADLLGVGDRLELAGELLAERAGRVAPSSSRTLSNSSRSRVCGSKMA